MKCRLTLQGSTRLLLTKIPFYKEVILMSFECDHCGFKNNEMQSGAETKAAGCRYTLRVQNVKDLNRKVVKSDYSSVKIVELDFEIPAQSQKGEITTVEGIIERAIAGLEQDQVVRRIQHPEAATQIDEFCDKLRTLKLGEKPFTIVIEDISGDCFIENPKAPHPDHQLTETKLKRTPEQDKVLGIFTRQELDDVNDVVLKPIEEGAWPLEELHGEVLRFDTQCPECGSDCDTNMKMTNIPHFKEVVIMATNCEACGCKTNEVKSGGGIEDFGVKIEVKVHDRNDFSRDVLKSETCNVYIPELDCDVGCAAVGGKFTTVEGLMKSLKEVLCENGAIFQDSSDDETRDKFDKFLDRLEAAINGDMQFTLVLDDPAGNSFVQALTDDYKDDASLVMHKYTRTFEQNEELGLNDMKVENYEEDHQPVVEEQAETKELSTISEE